MFIQVLWLLHMSNLNIENDYLTYDKVEVETSDDSIDVNQDTSVDIKSKKK